ncbi:Mutant cadherin [Labeo rohita]|uniref:Mutant cadherin n=1 Tax=Labeo rohita TaxID=84645 RepID=A0A498M7K4_LABRO|nr:Mutant cadherin [Labeo rohita]
MAAGGKMAAAACGAACGAATGRSKIRTKPEIYHTDTGQVIVEDELLNFLFVKLKTVKQDEIVLMATDCFGSEWIANSTKLLFELCPGSTRKLVAHTGPQKDSKNIRSCLKLLNEAGENVPRFVSHHLDELPPVTFNSLDVSCLLGKIEQLSVDITTMKQAVSLQTNTYNDLRIITTDINQRLSAIEQPRPNLKRGPVLQTIKPVTTQRVSTPQACEKTQDDMEGQTSEGDLSQMEDSASGLGRPISAAKEDSHVKWSDMAATPPWNLVQDKRSNNRRKQVHENASAKLKPRLNPHKGKKPAGIFGTGTGGDIQVIKSKLFSQTHY